MSLIKNIVSVVALGLCPLSLPSHASPNNDYVYVLTQPGALTCLSHIVFYEANLESYRGQEKVAISIMNRAVRDGTTICNVVKKPYQYSSYSRVKSFNKLTEGNTEKLVLDILARSMKGVQNNYGNITHFHSASITPSWASGMKLYGKDGGHIFYTELKRKM